MRKLSCIAWAVILISAASFSGMVYGQVKESFDYPAGDLDTQGAAADGWEGPWSMEDGMIMITDGNMEPDTQGKSIETVLEPGGTIIYYRRLADLWPDNGDPYWIGFMFQRRDDGSASSWGGLSLFLDSAELLFMGSPYLANRVGLDCTGYGAQNSEYSDMELTWVVVKLGMDGTAENDSAYLWVNPDPTKEPDIALSDARGAWKGSDGFNRIRIGNDASYVLAYDMIRIGTSFDQIKSGGGSGVSYKQAAPKFFGLAQNYPNPFNPSTTIAYTLQKSGEVRLSVFDLTGKEVAVLAEGPQSAGRHEVQFLANSLSSGSYFYRLQTANRVITRKMTLMK
jgi:hypothetical protein